MPGRIAPEHPGAPAGAPRVLRCGRPRVAGHRLRAQLATVSLVAPLAVTLGGCGHGAGDATTVLLRAAGAQVTLPTGATRPAVDGERLAAGDTVLAGPASPQLRTGGRVTTLAPGAVLHLDGRSAYRLARGSVVIDRRSGPAVALVAGAVTVAGIGRTAVRVDRGFAVRVAVYDGGSATVTDAEQTRPVGALHELLVPGDALPLAATPLRLTDDALDVLAAPDLTAVDVALTGRARGLDGPAGIGVARVLPAALRTVLGAAPVMVPALATAAGSALAVPVAAGTPGAPLSEQVLPVAIAAGAVGPAGTLPQVRSSYDDAATLRAAGGSWGVVAGLLHAPLPAVEDAITALADVAATAATAAPPVGSALSAPLVAPLLAAVGTALAPAAPADGAGGGGATPTPSASGGPGHPQPSGSPTPTGSGLVSTLLHTVTSLLPGPVSSALPPPLAPAAPVAPTPAVSVARPAPTAATSAPTTASGTTLLGTLTNSVRGALHALLVSGHGHRR